MKTGPSLNNMLLDVWLLQTLLQSGEDGIKLSQLQELWIKSPNSRGVLSRTTFNLHRNGLAEMFGLNIECTRNNCYRIANPEVLQLDSLANDLLASMQEYLFLDQYRDLGDAIQPQQIWAGIEYLHSIGDALRFHRKLKVRYQTFEGDEPYEAILQPYCLKADKGRWYILAVKEKSEHPIQVFALDRTLRLQLLEDTFEPDNTITPKTYFQNSFGVWVNEDSYPAKDIIVTVPQWVEKYWCTLPLHSSQLELQEFKNTDTPKFQFHISLTPDFLSELKKWDATYEVIE